MGRTFCQELPAALHPGGRLFIITNNFTFSAGLVLAALLKFHGGERASIVGETPGDRPSFWAEGGVFDLPGTRLPVRCATHYHNWEVGSRDPLASPWFNVLYNVPAGSLDPAPCVETAFGDYASGRDPVMGLIGQWLRE